MNRPYRVLLQTLGCRLNEAELESWALAFRRAGFRIVAVDEPADLIVVNTCAVTQEAVRKSRQILRRSRRGNPDARLVISGCLATLEPDALLREEGVALVIGNRDKDHLVETAFAALGLPVQPEPGPVDAASLLFERGRQRAFIKVQDGCRYQCTFCITTQARGDERSRPVGEVTAEVRELHRAGIQEIVLTGVHLGGYGSDDGTDLATLIGHLLAETEIPRIRLGSLEPWDLPEGFWALFEDRRLMPHLHLPLQSGSDAVLRRMARRCRTDEFARLVEQGRSAVPDLTVTTDLIAGFPGETADDWRMTLDVAAAMRFAHIHVFSYSPRAGTLAAQLPGHVDAETKKRRCQELQALAARLRRNELLAQVGKRVPVLFEGPAIWSETVGRSGYTPNFLPVRVGVDDGMESNQLADVVLTAVASDADILVGRPID